MRSSYEFMPAPRSALDGLRLDIPPEGILDPARPTPPPAWITLHNIVMSEGQLEKAPGWVKLCQTPDAAPVRLIAPIFYQSGATANLVVTTKNAFVLLPAGVIQPITPDGVINMTSNSRPEVDFLQGKYYVLVPGVGLFSFDGVSNLAAVSMAPGLPAGFLPRHLQAFANHLLVANFDGPNTGVDASGTYDTLGSGLNVADWDTANVDSEATLFSSPDNGSPITRLRRLQTGLLAIYKKDCIYNLFYNGSIAQEVYTVYPPQIPDTGCDSPDSLTAHGNLHRLRGADDLYVYDGANLTGFGRRVWQAWMAQMNAGAAAAIYGFDDLRSFAQTVLYGYQSKQAKPLQSFDQAMLYNYLYDAFSTRDWPFGAVGYILSAAAQTQLALGQQQLAQGRMSDTDQQGTQVTDAYEDFALVAGDDTGNLWVIDGTVATQNGQNAAATLETGDICWGHPDRISQIDGLGLDVPSLTGSPLQIYISTRRRLGDPVIYPAAPSAVYTPGQQWVNVMRANVWYRFKFVKTDGTMSFRGWGARVKDGGYF